MAGTASRAKKISQRIFHCALCGRILRHDPSRLDSWIYSHHTGQRYCLPGKCKGRGW
jgi:hypothetical protein